MAKYAKLGEGSLADAIQLGNASTANQASILVATLGSLKVTLFESRGKTKLDLKNLYSVIFDEADEFFMQQTSIDTFQKLKS